jgi:drug/metabolite transporter (DMT)-like permease
LNPSPLKSTPGTKPWLPDFVLLAATWGSSFMFTRLALVDFGALPSAGMRVLIGAVVLLLILAFKRQLPTLGLHWRKTFFVGLLNSAVPFACFAWALLVITTGLSAILNATVPLFGALIAWVWLKDRPSGTRALGLVIGFAGVVMLAWSKASFKPDASGTAVGISSGLAVLACLLACVFYGIAASFTKVHLGKIPPLVTATGSQCGATLALVVPMVWLWPAQNPGLSAWLAMLVSGVFCTGLAYVLYFRLIGRVGPAKAMTVTFLIPVFAVVFGVVFLGEAVTLWMLLCGVVIVCGTALSAGLVNLGKN